MSDETQGEPKTSPAVPDAPDRSAPPPPPPPWWRRPEMRRRVAMLVLVVGAAGLVAYWSRNRPVEVVVVYDFGRHAERVTRLQLSYARKGKETQPVDIEFPQQAPKRYRHTLRLIPGTYTVKARVYLRATADRAAEVKRHTRRVTIEGGEEQRLTLRLGR